METLVPHLVATLIYLSQIYSYYIRGDRSPLTCQLPSNHDTIYETFTECCYYVVNSVNASWKFILNNLEIIKGPSKVITILMNRAGALGWWLAPLPFTIEFGFGSGLGGFNETKMFLPHPRVKLSIVGSLRNREVACSASDRQGSSFESYVWRTVSSHSSHHPQDVVLAQFRLYVHKGGLQPDSFHFLLPRHIILCANFYR